jgi:protein FAM32A
MKPVFVGGSLSFKGDKKAKKKKSNKAKHSLKSPTEAVESVVGVAVAAASDFGGDVNEDVVVSAPHEVDLEADLTDAERRALKKKRERELQELGKLAEKSHRERVEEFNERLAALTEHNDIPRVRQEEARAFFYYFCRPPFAKTPFSLFLYPFRRFVAFPKSTTR